MFFAVWFPRTIQERVWTITPTLFLGSTFGIAKNDNTKDNKVKEEREGMSNGDQAQHMTLSGLSLVLKRSLS
jgi:hypothetical protein